MPIITKYTHVFTVEQYTFEAGVRELERLVYRICRTAVTKMFALHSGRNDTTSPDGHQQTTDVAIQDNETTSSGGHQPAPDHAILEITSATTQAEVAPISGDVGVSKDFPVLVDTGKNILQSTCIMCS